MRQRRVYDWLRRHPYLVDSGIVALLLLPTGVLELLTTGPLSGTVPTVLSFGLVLPLIWRRTYPLWVFAAVVLMCAVQTFTAQPPLVGDVGFLFALYAVSAYDRRRRVRYGALAVGVFGAAVGTVSWGETAVPESMASGFVILLLAVGLVWMAGDLMRTRRAYVGELEERARRLEIERDQQTRLARADERARIAREMHDVVAHSLSIVVAQADGGLYAGRTDPAAARRALDTIGTTGRSALAEMRRLLGVLRSDPGTMPVASHHPGGSAGANPTAANPTAADSTAAGSTAPGSTAAISTGATSTAVPSTGPELDPQPDLGRLDDLIEQVRLSGLPVSLRVEGSAPDSIPAGLGLAAYRIVQQALTNTLEHGGSAASAQVLVAYDPGLIRLEILDDGLGAAAPDDGAGHGLLGMRERAAVYGGAVHAGPRAGGGYAVKAELPFEVVPAESSPVRPRTTSPRRAQEAV